MRSSAGDWRPLGVIVAAIAAVGVFRQVLVVAAQQASVRLRGVQLTEASRVLGIIDWSALLAAVTIGVIGLLILGRIFDCRRPRLSRRVSQVVMWVPVRTRDAVWAFAATSIGVLLVQGWNFLPSLGDDATVYHSEVWRDLDEARSIADFLRPQSGLPGLVVIYGTLGRAIGRESTALLLTLAGLTALLVGLWILLREVGVSHRASGLLIPVSAALSYGAKKGRFDYGIATMPSLVPSPRFLAISFMVLAIAFLLAGRPVASTLVTLLSASIHALDGFVPMLLLLVSGLIVMAWKGQGPGVTRSRRDQTVLLVVTLALLVFVRNYNWIPFHEGGAPDFASVFVLTPSLVLLVVYAWRLMTPTGLGVGPTSWSLLTMLGSLLPFGLLFAILRSPSGDANGGGFLESLVLFETLIEQLRRPQAVLLSVQQAGTATMLVVLAAFLLAVLLAAGQGGSERHRMNARWFAVGALGALVFAVVGGLLNEYTTVPFVTSLYPFRQLWLLAVGALAAVGLVMDRLLAPSMTLPGLVPGVAGLLFLLWSDLEVGNTIIGLAAIAMLFALRKTPLVEIIQAGGPSRSGILADVRMATRGGLPLLLLVASATLLAGPVAAATLPTVSLEASLARIAHEGGQLDRDVIDSAQAAGRLIDGSETILVPFRPSSWTAFELISGHPAAFDFNVFLGTQDWYERFRRICDPGYRFDPDEDFSAVGLEDIVTCMAGQGPDEIRAVARSLGVSYGVVPTAQWDGSGVLHTTSSGAFVLVRFEAD